MPADVEETRFGFRFGPALVERTLSHDGFGVIVAIKGAREVLHIRVTPSGLIRIDEPKRKTQDWERKER